MAKPSLECFNPEMLILARRSLGWSQKQLSESSEIPQGSLSKYETGLLKPSQENIDRLVAHLGYTETFFCQTAVAAPPVVALHRKQARLGVRDQECLEATANIQRVHIGQWFRHQPWTVSLPKMVGEKPKVAAKALREQLKLGQGPVDNLTASIEALGVVVVYRDFGALPIDGFTLVGEDEEELPVIFLNANRPGDRLRLNLAHELGHLVLHEATVEDVEEQAWEFATELLVPEAEIRQSLQIAKLNLASYERLKRVWRVSMSSLIMRSRKLEILTDGQYRSLMVRMAPFRKVEPVKVNPEKATLLSSVIQKEIDLNGRDGMLTELGISSVRFSELYGAVMA